MGDRAVRPAISVITPVYNTEKYIDEAIQSVLAQSFAEWELLLVDDGSTDGSGAICDRYAVQDGRIRVFHTSNNGYGCARNLGLQNALGEWVLFLDSDDFLVPSALQCLLDHADKADLVMALYQTTPRATVSLEGIRGGLFETMAELGEALPELYEPYFMLSVAAKLYRRSVLGDGFDVESGQLMSDWLFNFRILPNCNGVCFVPEVVYYYRWGDHASHSVHFHSEWLYTCKKVYETVTGLFADDTQVEAFMARRYADRVAQHLMSIAALRKLNLIQKLVMIEAEREDPFYRREAICRASCGQKNKEIWEAFMARDLAAALAAAEKRGMV